MANDKTQGITMGEWNAGGLSPSKWSGLNDSYYKMVGIDMHTFPGLIQAEYSMAKETSGAPPDELCKVAVNTSNGAHYWFSAASGKIWQCSSVGVWSLVHTTTPAAGEAKCLGAAEFEGRLYWATQSRLHYITLANADDNDWSSDAVEDFATFTNADSEFHPMLNHNVAQFILYIGDGNKVHQVYEDTFTSTVTSVEAPRRIKTLGKFGPDLLIGTYMTNNVISSEVFRWDGWSPIFTNSDAIPEIGINTFFNADNMVLIQAGRAGNIYYYDGENLELFMRIPGDYSAGKTTQVHNYSVANHNGQILFGLSNIANSPADQLIYRIARNDRNHNYILDAPYPISERSGSDFVLTGLDLGAMLVIGDDIYISWANGATKGVDKISSNRLNGAYFETRVITPDRWNESNLSELKVGYASLPASTDIDFYTDVNYAGYGSALTSVDDTIKKIKYTYDVGTEFNTLQVKVKLTCSTTSTPQIESSLIEIR